MLNNISYSSHTETSIFSMGFDPTPTRVMSASSTLYVPVARPPPQMCSHAWTRRKEKLRGWHAQRKRGFVLSSGGHDIHASRECSERRILPPPSLSGLVPSESTQIREIEKKMKKSKLVSFMYRMVISVRRKLVRIFWTPNSFITMTFKQAIVISSEIHVLGRNEYCVW